MFKIVKKDKKSIPNVCISIYIVIPTLPLHTCPRPGVILLTGAKKVTYFQSQADIKPKIHMLFGLPWDSQMKKSQ